MRSYLDLCDVMWLLHFISINCKWYSVFYDRRTKCPMKMDSNSKSRLKIAMSKCSITSSATVTGGSSPKVTEKSNQKPILYSGRGSTNFQFRTIKIYVAPELQFTGWDIFDYGSFRMAFYRTRSKRCIKEASTYFETNWSWNTKEKLFFKDSIWSCLTL